MNKMIVDAAYSSKIDMLYSTTHVNWIAGWDNPLLEKDNADAADKLESIIEVSYISVNSQMVVADRGIQTVRTVL